MRVTFELDFQGDQKDLISEKSIETIIDQSLIPKRGDNVCLPSITNNRRCIHFGKVTEIVFHYLDISGDISHSIKNFHIDQIEIFVSISQTFYNKTELAT